MCCIVVDGEALDIVVVVVGCVGVDDEEDVSVVVDNIVAGKVVGVKDDDWKSFPASVVDAEN